MAQPQATSNNPVKMKRGGKVWYNGKVMGVDDARISLFTHGLHYGMGAFEGIRAYRQSKGGGAIFRLQDHLERLYESCKILDLRIPYGPDELAKACIDVCKTNGMDECYLRPIVFTADGPLGVYPGAQPPVDVAVLCWEWGNYLGDQGVAQGARLKISSFIRPHVNSAMTKGKITGQYVNSVMAKREAIAAGYDEALLLDAEGYLTEGSGENLFILREGMLKTTPLTSILNGITRKTVLEVMAHQGLRIVETRFTRDELYCADEIFLTGTAAEITPIREVDGRMIGRGAAAGKPGPVSLRLQKDYADTVRGKLPEFGGSWLTPIG